VTTGSGFSFVPATTCLQTSAIVAVSTVNSSSQPMSSAPVFSFASGFTTKMSTSSTDVHGSSRTVMTSSSFFGPSSGSTQSHSPNMPAFGMSSFGSNVTNTTSESCQPVQTHFGVSQGASVPSFGFGVASAPLFSFQPTQSVFGQCAATCNQPAMVQPSSFSFAAANSNSFVFGVQQSAPSATAVFGLGKRTNLDGASGDGNKRQATGLYSVVYLEFLGRVAQT